MHRIIAALLAATSCVAVTQAQTNIVPLQSVAPPLTLDQAVAIAGGNAPAADAARAGIAVAHAARTVAGLRPNPQFQSQVENVVGSGPYGGVRQAETTVGVNLPIELGGKRSARIAVANAHADRAVLLAAIAQADVRLTVTALYIDAVAAERRVMMTRDQSRIANDALAAARLRVRSGRASPIEEQRADVARLNAEADMQRTQRLATAALANLARRIGQPVAGVLDMAVLDRLPPATQGPTMVASAGTLVLAAADADLAIADAGVRLAKSQRVSDVTIGPAVRRLSATNDMAAVFALSMPIPLFNAGRATVAQASAQRAQAAAQRRVTLLDVEQAITDGQAEADNAAVAARVATGPAMAAAQEAARIARIGYREGKFGQLDLLDAERTLAQTRLAAIDALASYQNARARLERLIAPAPEQGE